MDNVNASPAIFHDLLKQMHLPSLPSDVGQKRLYGIVGQSCIERLRLRNGIEIHTWDFTPQESDAVELRPSVAFIDVNFLLPEHIDDSVDSPEYSADAHVPCLNIRIPQPVFEQLLRKLSPDLHLVSDVVETIRGESYCQESLDPAVQVILWQMLHCTYTKGIRTMYMEAKVTELLAIYCWAFLGPSPSGDLEGPARDSVLRGTDAEKLHDAQRLLLLQMKNPPSLVEIARQVGLNEFKLKAGFKELFGTTVFGYLREKRIERALYLLQQGRMTIKEVASAVGYSNPGYFAAAFREKYGIKPSQLVRSQ